MLGELNAFLKKKRKEKQRMPVTDQNLSVQEYHNQSRRDESPGNRSSNQDLNQLQNFPSAYQETPFKPSEQYQPRQ